jgi:nucleoporin POM152
VQCQKEVTGLERRIHPLPSVKIQEGLDSLREGDEPAVFVVTFKGTAPFAFTYTRSEQIGHARSKVVETQVGSVRGENREDGLTRGRL